MSKTKYIGLTIGPIYKTIKRAKATRELWAASYLFSYLMRRIVRSVQSKGMKVILPHMESADEEIFKTFRVGLVPDQALIVVQNESDWDNFNRSVQEEIQELGQKIYMILLHHGKTVNIDDVKSFVSSYFQGYSTYAELKATDNPIFKLSEYFATAEHQQQFRQNSDVNYIDEIFLLLKKIKHRKTIIRTLFGDISEMPDILSLAEVATRELLEISKKNKDTRYKDCLKKLNNKKKDEEGLFYEVLKNQYDEFRTYHKYVAIVHADGDNVGGTIAKLTPNQLEDFSELLYKFSKDAADKIQGYGGLPIYAGGDDLLFFAPIRQINVKDDSTTLFDLMESLDKSFKQRFQNFCDEKQIQPEKAASLSFGVSISYYKFPMNEAIATSAGLLFGTAKNTPSKNAVALKVLKHSGQTFSHTFSINSKLYKVFNHFMAKAVNPKHENSTINSMIYTLDRNSKVLEITKGDKTKIENFLRNSFNETVHKTAPIRSFIFGADEQDKTFKYSVKYLLVAAFEETPDQPLETVYSILRTINFLKRKDNDNE